MKKVALENPNVLPSAAEMYGLMVVANTLVTISCISCDDESFFILQTINSELTQSVLK